MWVRFIGADEGGCDYHVRLVKQVKETYDEVNDLSCAMCQYVSTDTAGEEELASSDGTTLEGCSYLATWYITNGAGVSHFLRLGPSRFPCQWAGCAVFSETELSKSTSTWRTNSCNERQSYPITAAGTPTPLGTPWLQVCCALLCLVCFSWSRLRPLHIVMIVAEHRR